jgi:NADH-quinone oxidoreductase subunit J
MMNSATIFFLILATAVVVTAVAMLLSRNTIYAALMLILNFSVVAVLYLVLGAPFIAFAQITVYAGAIMILFLFVIMLLGVEKFPWKENLRGQRPLAILLGVVILVEAAYLLIVKGGSQQPLVTPEANFGNPTDIGMALFSKYMLPFEVTSLILLVAVIGAIVLTKIDQKGVLPPHQVSKAGNPDGQVDAKESEIKDE